jgi:hypothetical protein
MEKVRIIAEVPSGLTMPGTRWGRYRLAGRST